MTRPPNAEYYLHPYYYRIVDEVVLRCEGGEWVESCYDHAATLLSQPDIKKITEKDIGLSTRVRLIAQKYAVPSKAVMRMVKDKVILL